MKELLLSFDKEWFIATIWALMFGIFTNFSWDWIKNNLTFVKKSDKYINIVGNWTIDVVFNSESPRTYVERLEITQQFGRNFKGVFFSPNPTDSTREIEQLVTGHFIDKSHLIYSYIPNGEYTEYGSGMVSIEPNHRRGSGASVNFGISSKDPVTAFIVINKTN